MLMHKLREMAGDVSSYLHSVLPKFTITQIKSNVKIHYIILPNKLSHEDG